MALISINGVELPTPSEYSVGIQDISQGGRNAKGDMIIERIATKRKIELSWKVMDATELASLLNKVSPVFFTVNYIDPQENTMKTGTFYSGDRTAPMLQFINGVPKYKDIKLSLVEK